MDDATLTAHAVTTIEAAAALHRDAAGPCAPPLVRAARAVAESLEGGGKLIVFGNGGSAADAQHLAAEFVGRFVSDRPALAAIALTDNPSAITAIGNDYGYEHVFARQVAGLGKAGDVAMAISTSGASPNVLAGVQAARDAGMITISLTGGPDSRLASIADIPILVPSATTRRVQECHLIIEHVLCECVEAILFPSLSLVEQPQHEGVRDSSLRSPSAAKVVPMAELVVERERWRREGKVVVWTNGCFDLLHVGHLQSMEAARGLGDVLVVGINDDDAVRALKGQGRPVVPAPERALLIAALEVVTRVVVFPELTPEAALRLLQPDLHCKGADYASPHGQPIPEAPAVEAYGGRLEFLPLVSSRSSSSLIARIKNGPPS